MSEFSSPWDGSTVGDAADATYGAPYDANTEFADILTAISGAYTSLNIGGPFRFPQTSPTGELAVSGIASPISVDAGAAVVRGTVYWNSAALAVVVATPALATRIDRIVLRKDYVAQTVRITRIAGVEGGAAPAITQTVGVIWDVPLAQVSTTVGGVCTVTDERELIPFPDNSFPGVALKDRAVTNIKLALNSVDDTIVGIKVPRLPSRQGGDPTDWNVAGLLNYDLTGTGVLVQVGNAEDADFDSFVAITFPIPFSAKPLVFIQTDNQFSIQQTYVVGGVTVNGFNVIIQSHFINPLDPHELSNVVDTFNWLAIGPCVT